MALVNVWLLDCLSLSVSNLAQALSVYVGRMTIRSSRRSIFRRCLTTMREKCSISILLMASLRNVRYSIAYCHDCDIVA